MTEFFKNISIDKATIEKNFHEKKIGGHRKISVAMATVAELEF